MSHQPYYQQGYSPPPKKKGLPVWTLAILVFASVFVVGMVIVILIGVSSNSGSVNQTASPAAIVPTAPGASVGNLKGLGQDKVSWENEHGPAATGSLYESGKYYLMFDGAGKAWHLERSYGKSPADIETARAEAKAIMPPDAQFVKTYTSQVGSTIDLYKSDLLASRISGPWTGGEPGNFIAVYRNQTGKVTTFILGTGNNP